LVLELQRLVARGETFVGQLAHVAGLSQLQRGLGMAAFQHPAHAGDLLLQAGNRLVGSAELGRLGRAPRREQLLLRRHVLRRHRVVLDQQIRVEGDLRRIGHFGQQPALGRARGR
jgi:hypothetical protein